jgi:hypothetical protein
MGNLELLLTQNWMKKFYLHCLKKVRFVLVSFIYCNTLTGVWIFYLSFNRSFMVHFYHTSLTRALTTELIRRCNDLQPLIFKVEPLTWEVIVRNTDKFRWTPKIIKLRFFDVTKLCGSYICVSMSFCYFCFSVRPDCWWIAPNAYTALKWF